MRHHSVQDVSRITDPVAREILRRITTDLADISTRVGGLSASTGGSSAGAGAARNDEAYVVTTASGDLSNEKLLVTTSPITGTVGASTVTLAAPTAVTSAASITDDGIVVGAGGAQGVEARGVKIDSSNFRLRETGGEWIAMASTTAMTAQAGGAASGSEDTLHSEAMLSGILDVAGRVLHVRAFGTWTADATPPGTWTLRLKYGSTAVWSVTLAPVGGPYTDPWKFECDVITTSSGNTRAYGIWFDMNGGAVSTMVPADIAIARTPTTSGAVTVSLTIQWAGADAGSNFLCEMCQFELGGLTA